MYVLSFLIGDSSFPVGLELERLRAEIVLDPDFSLEFIGKGYLERVKMVTMTKSH